MAGENEENRGKKRENPNKDQDQHIAKKPRLNDSGSDIQLSQISVPEQKTTFAFTLDKANKNIAGTMSEDDSDEQSGDEKILSQEEQENLIAFYRKTIAELKTNQPGIAKESDDMVLTKKNNFSLRPERSFFKLPTEIQEELFSKLCNAIQQNTQIKSFTFYSLGSLSSDQTEKLILAARNSSIKTITLNKINFTKGQDAARFFESVVLDNPHLEQLRFATADFHISNRIYNFTGRFQNPKNAESLFTQPALNSIDIKIHDVEDFNIIFQIIEKNQNIQKINVDWPNVEMAKRPGHYELYEAFNALYKNLNKRLKTNYKIILFDLDDNYDNSLYNEEPKELFKMLIKRNQDLNQFSADKNLILYYYSGLDAALADKPNEALSQRHQTLLDYVTTKDGKINIELSMNELNLLDSLLETQLRYDKKKQNKVFENVFENHSETITSRKEAKSKFDVTFDKSQAIKREIIKRSQQLQVAATIGKDMYSSSSSSAETPTDQLTASQKEWFGMSF